MVVYSLNMCPFSDCLNVFSSCPVARRLTHENRQQRNFCRQKFRVCVERHISFYTRTEADGVHVKVTQFSFTVVNSTLQRNNKLEKTVLDRWSRSDRPRYCVITPILAGHWPLTLNNDHDFQSRASYGHDPQHTQKLKSKGQLVQKIEWKQTDGQTDGQMDRRYQLFFIPG